MFALVAVSTRGGASRAIFGLGVYNDTPGSPALNLQLPLVANLTSPGGWVTILLTGFSAIGPPDGSRVNLTPLPWEVAALEQAYALGLRVIARIACNTYTRYVSDDEAHLQYRAVAAAYREYVAQLPLPPDGVSPLHVHVGNEPNECIEWGCKEGLGLYGDVVGLFAPEAAGFQRDVLAALSDLPRLRLVVAPVASSGPAFCECRYGAGSFGAVNGTAFLSAMLAVVPALYAPASAFSAHPYPACQEAFAAPCARGWLASYQDQHAMALASWGGAERGRFPILLTETGWSGASEADKATWIVDAFEQLFLTDGNVDAVTPFLLAGQLWAAAGWPWSRWTENGTLLGVQPQYLALQALARGA